MPPTTTTTTNAARRRAQAALFGVVNVPMRLLLGLPVPTPIGKRLMLVHHIGRRTGKRYRQPVSYVEHEGTLLTPGGGRWTRNLRDSEPVHIRLQGRDLTVRPELVADPDQIEHLLSIMGRANPTLYRFVPIPRAADGHFDRSALAAAIEHGFRVVRWRLDPRPDAQGRPSTRTVTVAGESPSTVPPARPPDDPTAP